ncbi:MAG TPA: GAF domain-containing protein [Stellaceae bacterium]|jgi:signal transduction histidine kinase
MSAENAGMPALPVVSHAESTAEPPLRGRLFRKYVLFFVGLVAVALLVNSGFDFWFGYQENKAALVGIQQEKADAAAQRIAEFADEIERQIGWTTHAEWSAAPLDQRRFDYVRLLSQVPAITEITELDKEGKEQLKVSRLAMDVVGSNQDFSKSPAFTEAKAHKVWFSPVYFRKESEPYMTLALARAGRNAGVTVAEVNLKLIWDVITALKIGEGGYAYVVDQRGKLLAHPDISLVLRDTDFLHLQQVAAALHQTGRRTGSDVTVTRNNAGTWVLSAHATIPQLDWLVFVEVPLQEAYAPLYGAALRGIALLLLGLLGATLAALVLARRMTGPIRELQEGAARIGAGALDRRIEIHTGDELEALANQFNRMAGDLEASYAELENRVEERTAELAGLLDQQTATAEVLEVISSSPGRLEPVFEAVLENAVRICGGSFGMLGLRDGDGFRGVATHGADPDLSAGLTRIHHPPPGTGLRRMQETLETVAVLDCAAEPAYDAVRANIPAMALVRTALHVPMLKESEFLGAIMIYRREVLAFTDKEVALVESFAKQAAIAIENARLMSETQEALDQQTATAEVLQVINSSPGDLTPVFDAMLEKALRLCDASLGTLWTYDGERMHPAAIRGASPEYDAYLSREPLRPGAGALGSFVRGGNIVSVVDLKDTDAYRSGDAHRRALVDLGNGRSLLGIPLRTDEQLVGAFLIYRREPQPFSAKQIALLQNFAAQAVIAMQNARLITETQEALDQQTATAEVLGVINSSPGDLAPVFDAMLEKAMRLCEATFGQLSIYDGERFNTAATYGVPPAFAEYRRRNPPAYGPNTQPMRLLAGERVIHDADLKASELYDKGDRNRRALVDLGGARSSLIVALVRDEHVLGFVHIYRQEVRPFSDKQIALLQNFAAQAVIAMENARLLGEIRQRQAELRVTFDNMADGVVMFDQDLRLAAWNRNFQEVLDLPDGLLEARKTYAEYLHILAERGEFGAGDVEEELTRRLAHADEELRFERTRPDGRILEVRRNAVAGGGFVLIYSDITERKRSEGEIRAARDAAEKALGELKTAQASLIQAEKMASLGQLTAGIAHEIKNPLNFVNNFANLSIELLDELKEIAGPALETLDEDKRADLDDTMEMLTGNLDKIGEHGRRADNIVKSMLEHSRGVTGERREVDINALIEESLNLAYHGARAQDQTFNIALERDFDTALKPIELVPQDITRVFLNLFGNGFYAAGKRAKANGDNTFRPVLRVATHEDGGAVEIKVRDNGTGIPPNIRDKLFQPFFTTKPTGEGTGLGLSISYDIVTQQHGGTIAVNSEEGSFTEFTIRLPRA